jgi:hypothetical protein
MKKLIDSRIIFNKRNTGNISGFGKSGMLIVLAVIVIVGISLVVYFSKRGTTVNANLPISNNNSANTTANKSESNEITKGSQLKTIDVPLPAKAYTSTEDGFTVNYSVAPKIRNSSFRTSAAGLVPFTEYREKFSSGTEYAWYTVNVLHYPSSYKFADDFLSTALKAFIGVVNLEYPGTTITDQQPIQFLGNAALSGLLTVPVKLDPNSTSTTNTGDYFLVTIKNHNVYIIDTYGMNKNNYNAFVISFKFEQ